MAVPESDFIEYPVPELPGIRLCRIRHGQVYNLYFSGANDGDAVDLEPGFVFADQQVFGELALYQGAPVQCLGARIRVLGHVIVPVVFEVDQHSFRLSQVWGEFVHMARHDAFAGSQLLVLNPLDQRRIP